MAIEPPTGKRVFNFAPIIDGGPRDLFQDKVYLGIYYDLSENEASNDDKEENAGADNKDLGDEMSHIEMIMHVSFPKDKEELKRKKLEAMMKKINADGQAPVELGRDGERRILQITKELNQYYHDNRVLL